MKVISSLNFLARVVIGVFAVSCFTDPGVQTARQDSSITSVPTKIEWNALSKNISDDSLHDIIFDENNYGWVSGVTIGDLTLGATNLYRTADSGVSWSRMELKLNEGAFISSLHATNDKVWLVAQKYDTSDRRLSSASIRQSLDQGKTWIDRHNFTSVYIQRLKFDASGKGMLVGTRFQSPQQKFDAGLVLFSTDFGGSWRTFVDSTTKAKSFDDDPNPSVLNKDPMSDITPISDKSYVALSVAGSVIKTTDGGANWTKIADFKRHDNDSIGYRKLIVGEDMYWVLSNTNLIVSSLSETQTTSSIPSIGKSEGFYDYGFSDMVAFPDSSIELVSCGWIREGEKRIATIFHSVDAGKTWHRIYRDDRIDTFNSIGMNKTNTVVAVGEKGTIVSLSKVQ